MEIAIKTSLQILQMLVILSIGAYAYKKEIISNNGLKTLTNLLLEIVMPLLIFTSYQRDYNSEQVKGLIITFFLSILSIIIAIIISIIVIKKNNKRDYLVERMSIMYTNCGFIGIPLMSALYGPLGVFYCTGFITAYNLICWSYGISMLVKLPLKEKLIKIFTGRNMIAIALGLLFYFFSIRIPETIVNPMKTIGSMNSPLALLIVGGTIMKSPIRKIFFDLRSYYILFIHNLIIPLIIILLLSQINTTNLIKNVILIAMACPIGVISTTFSLKFNRDEKYASSLLGLSTIFSIITIPLAIYINTFFL